VSSKPPRIDGPSYVPARSDAPGEVPPLRQGEVGTNEADGTAHVMKSDGRVSTLPTAQGFRAIVTLTQTQYDALDPKDASTLYIVTADPE
jgi:hypothetical protein